jgi:hypothetical protein
MYLKNKIVLIIGALILVIFSAIALMNFQPWEENKNAQPSKELGGILVQGESLSDIQKYFKERVTESNFEKVENCTNSGIKSCNSRTYLATFNVGRPSLFGEREMKFYVLYFSENMSLENYTVESLFSGP